MKEQSYYHIYHRGLNSADLFFRNEDYSRFLNRYFYYTIPAAETLAYCLLKNHFHSLIYIRNIKEQKQTFERAKYSDPNDQFHGLSYRHFKPYRISWQFGHLFNSHTKYMNMKYNRSGKLFESRFKRIEIDSNLYLSHMICYIHRNPIHHNITDDYSSYRYSSYSEHLSGTDSMLARNKVLRTLGGKKNYVASHLEFAAKLGKDYYLD